MSDKDGNGFNEQDVEFGNPRQINLDYTHILDEFKHQQNIPLATVQSPQPIMQDEVTYATVNDLKRNADARITQEAYEHRKAVEEHFHQYDVKLNTLLKVSHELSHSLLQAMSHCETQIQNLQKAQLQFEQNMSQNFKEFQEIINKRHDHFFADMINMAKMESHIT